MISPNTHIIGVQKAATTSLFYWLGQHEEVYAPLAAKDYPFFADNKLWEQGVDNYLKLFSKAGKQKIILAGSVHTLKFSYARKRLHQIYPDATLIVVLRDPIDRLVSAYNYRAKTGAEQLDFTEALQQEVARSTGPLFEDNAGGAYIEHGFYCKQLKELMKLFAPERIKILWFEEIVATPTLVLRDLFQFLGIDADFEPDLKKKNVTGQIRNQWLFNLCFGDSTLRHWAVNHFFGKIVSLEKRSQIRHWLKEINTVHTPSDIPTGFCREELVNVFIKDIECLELLTDRDLTAWKRC